MTYLRQPLPTFCKLLHSTHSSVHIFRPPSPDTNTSKHASSLFCQICASLECLIPSFCVTLQAEALLVYISQEEEQDLRRSKGLCFQGTSVYADTDKAFYSSICCGNLSQSMILAIFVISQLLLFYSFFQRDSQFFSINIINIFIHD